MNKKNISKILLYIFIFLQIINYETVLADIQVSGDIGTGAANGTSVTYDGIWDQKVNTFAFRITLVDKNGKKVDNTKSIDYRYSGCLYNDNRIRQESNNKNVKYDYKYGENEGNYDSYTANLVNKQYCGLYKANPDYTNFVKEFTQIIKTRSKKFDMYTPTPTGEEKFTADFTTMFLYHSGFLKRNTDEKYFDIDDLHWLDKKKEMIKKQYYLLIEPKFSYSYGAYTAEGTAKEIISYFLYDIKTQPWFSTASFKYTLAMGMNTTVEDAKNIGFEKIIKDQNQITIYNGTINPDYTDKEFRAIVNDEYGFGAGVLQLSDIIPEPEEEKLDIYIKENYCQTTENESNNGTVGFELSTTLDRTTFDNSKDSGYAFKKYNSVNAKIYCYDDATYNFNNLIDSLNGTTVKTSTYATILTGTITINRHCLVYSPSVEYETAKKTFLDNFKEYEEQEIPLNVYNNTIKLKKIETITTEDKTKLNNSLGVTTGLYHTTATITFGYTENDSKVYVTKNYENGTAYVDLSNVTFGYSNDLKNQVQDGQVYTYDKYIFTTHVTSSGDSMKCSFKTTTENTDASELIKFRTISLENPFPARDASSRLPGTNWFGKDNYVRTYINHNRGTNGSDVYNKEPIYTITLTPSQMIKIREYNKKHSYNDIELECVGENNTSCLSKFLRETINKDNITGTCSTINSENIKADANNFKQYSVNEVTEAIKNAHSNPFKLDSTNSIYDFNKDGVLSLRDAYIYDNKDKTTNYYTCADKTYENSGYLKEEDNNE